MKTILFTFSIFVTLCIGQDLICHEEGNCEDGYELGVTFTDTYLECQEQCQLLPDCNYFTHEETSSICELLANCTEVSPSACPTCYTGERNCSKYVCSQAGECQGVIVGQHLVDYEEECLEKCYENEDCIWYSFQYDIEHCMLTANCVPQESDKTFIGQRGCYQPHNDSDPS